MGIGLVIAVLGIGSTFASSITINSDNNTEFGQGVQKTVYCGGDATVDVTPVSSFSNGINSLLSVKLVTPGSGSETSIHSSYSTLKQTIYGSTNTRYPKFNSGTTNISGWWVYSTSPLSAATITTALTSTAPANYPVSFTAGLTASNWYFIQETSTGKFKTGYASVSTAVSIADDPANFKFSGLVISNIPTACAGVNFVFSGYGDSGSAKTLVSDISVVAAKWTGVSGSVTPSSDRTCQASASGITATQKSSSLTFAISSGALSAKELAKVVVETQEDALTGNSCSS
jgi:hypothetical protein